MLQTKCHNVIYPLCGQWHQTEALGGSVSSFRLKFRENGTRAKPLGDYLKQENSLSF